MNDPLPAHRVPELSVIVPALDEAPHLLPLLEDLARQRGLALEVLLADGGSSDGTPELAGGAAARLGLPLRVIACGRGRGRQMNRAAATARAPLLLFLHADSRLPDPELLATALAFFHDHTAAAGTHRVAGHFGLRFVRRSRRPSRAYYFYEAKTRLPRADCVRGDQGVLLPVVFFRQLGGFDERHPYLEDLRLAARVDAVGGWLVLPGALHTSARRFESEGLRQRQTLNALLCNFDHIGMHGYFDAAGQAYREQRRSQRLYLLPFFRLAHRVARSEGWRQLVRYWYGTGRYVAANAWQLAFACDCRANQRDGWPPGLGPRLWLGRYRRWLEHLLTSAPAALVSACLTAGWFYGVLALHRLCRGRRS